MEANTPHYFNSIKVRLKLYEQVQHEPTLLFQFHKGTIKTVSLTFLANWYVSFQFHKGTIKTYKITKTFYLMQVFQFHKGTIKTPQ